jgi:hypothetical protein
MTLRPTIDRAALMVLANDLPATWNAPGTDTRTKQRITHILIGEVVLDCDDATNEALVKIHWNGGRHTELRISRARTGRYPGDRHPNPVEAIRKLGGQLPDRELAVTMNRMRCKPSDGNAWTTVRVRELRERLGDRRFRSDATAYRDNQRRRRRDPARHLCRLGPQADPRGHASRDAADAVGALADPPRRTPNRGRQDRRTRNSRPPAQVLQALSRG